MTWETRTTTHQRVTAKICGGELQLERVQDGAVFIMRPGAHGSMIVKRHEIKDLTEALLSLPEGE